MTTKKTIFTHRPRVSLARFPFCWWRHTWLLMTSQWPDNCDAITWIVISNSLGVDFIHGDIHGRSCKKKQFNVFDSHQPRGYAFLIWGRILSFVKFISKINSFSPSGILWRHRSGTILARVMACCMTVPRHYPHLSYTHFVTNKIQFGLSEISQEYHSHQSLKLAWILVI